MEKTLHQLVVKYNIPVSWLAEILGFSRTQVSNWVTDPAKYPIPADKKIIVQQQLRKFGSILTDIEII